MLKNSYLRGKKTRREQRTATIKVFLILTLALLLGGLVYFLVSPESSDLVNNLDKNQKEGYMKKALGITKEEQDNLRKENSEEIIQGITKEYISNEKRILIKEGETILLNLQLESDYEVAVVGWNDMDLIAWFNLKDFIGNNLIEDVKFYDVNNNYEELNKVYDFRYQNSSNDWVIFNSLSDLPNKNIRIGLFTDIIGGDKIEWVIERDDFKFLEWALVYGTNIGFVTTAPISDPTGAFTTTMDSRSIVLKVTAPEGSIKITEMGWYTGTATEEANFEVALYASDGIVEPGEAGTRLFVDNTNAKGTGDGWKVVSGLDWAISPSTIYWLGVQLDNTVTTTNIDRNVIEGDGQDVKTSETTLTDPYGGGEVPFFVAKVSLYALIEISEIIPPNVTINNPVNTTFTTNTILFNVTALDNNATGPVSDCRYSLDSDSTNVTMTNASTSVNNYNATDTNVAQGSHTTTFFCNDSLNNLNNTESVTFFIDSINPFLNITFPINKTNHTTALLDINFTRSDTNLATCWYSNDTFLSNTTLPSCGNITNVIWSQGNHNLTIWVNDTLGNQNQSSIVFTIDSIVPAVDIFYPVGAFDSFQTTLDVNWTITDTNLAECWFDYNSINTTVVCSEGNSTLTSVVGKQSVIMYANDTFNNVNSDTTSWIYNFIENNVTFVGNVSETSSQNFEINVTTDLTVLSISAILSYNGTNHTSTASCIEAGSSNCTITNTIDIPLIIGAENVLMDFFWTLAIFNGSDSSIIQTSTRQQNITRIHLEECDATYKTPTLNFTAFDEETTASINPFLFEGDFDIWLGSGSVKRNISFTETAGSEDLCLQPNETMNVDAIINYDEGSGTNYVSRFYYFDEHEISNISQDISLYLLKSNDSTTFILKVQDDSLLPVADALIEIHRFFPGEGIFRIVQIAKTDDSGKSVGFFKTETVDYKFVIKKGGETLLETNQQRIIPESSPFTIIFNTGDNLGEPWASQNDILLLDSSLTWNESSGIITYIYIDTSGNFTQARLLVVQESLVNSTANLIICNDTSSLTASTITCTVSTDNGFFVASGFITRDSEVLDKQFTFQIETLSGVVGTLGLFLGFFIILISAFMFKFNEIAGVWAITITVFLVNLMGLIKFGGVFVTAIIAMAIIITWVMEK